MRRSLSGPVMVRAGILRLAMAGCPAGACGFISSEGTTELMASNLNKQLIYGSFGAAGLVALLCVIDLLAGFPFSRSVMLDILFLLSAAVVGYLAWDALKDQA